MVSGEKLTTATGEDSPFELNLSFRPRSFLCQFYSNVAAAQNLVED